ncbi:MAG TPA: hypothetical protein VM841_02190 [Actinomycetota bacterium]|nr:hypothetical protein [Actinomycetota bacterium]
MTQQERSVGAAAVATVATDAATRPGTVRELADSLLLFGLTVTSLGAYVGIALVAVRLLGTK